MKLHACRLTPFLFAALSSVYAFGGDGLGNNLIWSPGPGFTTEAQQISESAGRHPNATSSVAFKRDFNGTSEDWSWTVNVTEIPYPDVPYDDANVDSKASFTKGYRVTNTQWQLQWPGNDDDFDTFLYNRGLRISVAFEYLIVSASVKERYNSQNAGDCSSVLGSECASFLKEQFISGRGAPVDLPGCKGSFGKQDGGLTGAATSKFPTILRCYLTNHQYV